MTVEKHYGPHKLVQMADNWGAMHFGEELTEAVITEMMDDLLVMLGETEPCFVLLDFTGTTGLSAPVRRIVGERARRLNLVAIGMYGATFQMKVVVKLVNGAISLFRKNPIAQEFFNDKESAVAWIERKRREQEENKK